MKRKEFRLILLILIILIFAFAVSYIILGTSNDSSLNREIIANDTNGTVEVIRNIGNPDGEKIAYVVGVHPLENDTHQTFLNMMPALDNLNYSYDIYIINVSEDFSKYGELLPDDEPGRQTGQELALKYVYPQIVNGSYKLAVDVHAHGGAYGEHETFVFSPVDGSAGESYGRDVSMNSQNISYYNPYFTTSGPYLTVPLNENGVPAFYFEENSFFPQDIKDSHMLELIRGVDNLKL
ncbi:hypothetical protein [Methanobrevibacter sp.]|uniref:hypothetical protein n=1 Tax=Methanobrevibacter sp. TaxID=66852 RepID=UPI00388EFDDB